MAPGVVCVKQPVFVILPDLVSGVCCCMCETIGVCHISGF